MEVNKKMTEHLKNLINYLPKELGEKIVVLNHCLEGSDSEYSIDKYFKNEKISLINMDIEGFEMEVLDGAKEKIKNDKPVLAIAAYHKPEDLLIIPQFVKNQSDDYHIFFRKYRGYCPEAMNEYIYYAVPKERMIGEIAK